MPRFDGTGQQGQGSRTVGGFGRCMPDAISTPLYGVGRGGAPFGGGRGFAHGGGRGRCRMTPRVGFAPAPPYDDAQKRELLRQEAQQLQAQLDRINAPNRRFRIRLERHRARLRASDAARRVHDSYHC